MTVSIDDDFARFGGKSYAINKINSVEVRTRAPYGRGGAILLGILAAITLLMWIASFRTPEGQTLIFLVVAAICAFFAVRKWQKSAVREHQLFLMTSSSETQAFITRDAGEVETLRAQIEAAMLRHSRVGFGQ